ncbi:MAG: transporter substrate-binding domain-containing protein [Negativicutes bacterium]|jgi:polar amino acid transport system substrate-binding protein
MNKLFMILLTTIMLGVTVIFVAGCGNSKTADRIIVGVDNNPPYTFVTQPVSVILDDGLSTASVAKTAEYQGFDVDVITAAAKKAGLTIEFRDIAFGKIFEQIEQGKNIDVAIGGVSITDDRKQNVGFTIPYAKGGACIVAFKNDNITSADDLSGKIVGVELNTTMVPQASAIKGAKIRGYQNQQDMFIDLFNGDLDAIIMDKMSAEYALSERKMKRLKIVNMLSDEEFAMVVKKDNTQLIEKLNKALTEMKKNGELQKIYDKWFAKK